MPLPPLFCGFLHVLPPSRSVYPRHRTLRPGGPSPRSGGFPEAAALRLLAGRLGERERAAEGRGFVSLWGTGNGEGGRWKGRGGCYCVLEEAVMDEEGLFHQHLGQLLVFLSPERMQWWGRTTWGS